MCPTLQWDKNSLDHIMAKQEIIFLWLKQNIEIVVDQQNDALLSKDHNQTSCNRTIHGLQHDVKQM